MVGADFHVGSSGSNPSLQACFSHPKEHLGGFSPFISGVYPALFRNSAVQRLAPAPLFR